VIDHLIISDRSYLSFADIGLLDELKESTKYVPPYILVERMREKATEIAKRKNSIEIAKTMKRANEPLDKIAEFTGISLEEVKKLRVRKK